MSTKKFAIPTRRLPTKYYKYTYENWTQPIATGQTTAIDGGNMVITATNQYSSAYPWLAMDGTNSNLWVMNDTTTGYWQLKLPYKIWVIGLTFYNIDGGNKTRVARFYTGSDLSTPIGDQFTASSTDFGQTVVSNIPAGGIETDTIYLKISSSYGASSGMSELKITAKRRTGSVESTSSDYDYKVTEVKEYLPARRMGIKYYKYGTEPNINIIGSPTISKGVVSGFSTSNYLTIPKKFPTKATNFEFVFKFKSSSFSSWQYWFNTAPYYSFLLGTSSSGKIVLYASSNTTSWDISNGIEGVTALNTNTWYYVKCTYDGQTYKVYISTDKVNWNSEITISSIITIGVAYDVCWIGNGWVDQAGVNTTIDLTQSYIKISGSDWWRGTKAVISNSSDYDYKVIENKEYLPVR